MSKKIAFCGLMSTIAVIFGYLGVAAPTGRLGFYLLSTLPVAAVVISYGVRAALLVYVVVSLLLFILGAIQSAVLFALFFGAYIFVKLIAERRAHRVWEFLIKYSFMNGMLYVLYFIQSLFFHMANMEVKYLLIFAMVVQIIFFIYDLVVSQLIYYYKDYILKQMRR